MNNDIHKNKLGKLLSGDNPYKIELDLDSILEKTKTKKKVLVRGKGKTFYREQEVGREEKTGPVKVTSVRVINSALKKANLPLSKSGSIGAIKGRSLSVSGAGVDIIYNSLVKEWDIDMRYGFKDVPTPDQKKNDLNEIKKAFDTAGIQYVLGPGASYLIVKKE